MKKIQFHIIRGLPGSGKSSLAREVVSNLVTGDSIIIDPDEITPEQLAVLKDHFENVHNEKTLKFRANLIQAISALQQGIDVIWTQAWSKHEGIEYTLRTVLKEILQLESTLGHELDELLQLANMDFRIFSIEIDRETAISRVKSRHIAGEHYWDGEKYEEEFPEIAALSGTSLETFTTCLSGNVELAELVNSYFSNIYVEK